MALALECCRLSRRFPLDERFGLASQLRRAAVSVPANLAEGHARRQREFPRYISIARGSLAEVEVHVEIAEQLGYVTKEQSALVLAQVTRLRQLSDGLHRALLAKYKTRRESDDCPA